MIRLEIKKSGPIFNEPLRKRIPVEELRKGMQYSVSLLEGEIARRTPTGATGILRRSITGRIREVPSTVEGVVGSSLVYALPVEKGRRAGPFPSVKQLQYWARRKLNLSPAEAERAGFLIARKIARRGIKGVEMFGKSLSANKAKIEAIFRKIGTEISIRLNG